MKYFIGIDVGGTNIKYMIMSSEFEVIAWESMESRAEEGYEAISDRLLSGLDGLFEKNCPGERQVLAIGMGLPGIVDVAEQKAVYLSRLLWEGFNPCEKVARHYNAPCVIDNDGNMTVVGECYFGNTGGARSIVFMSLGTGVGGSVINDGQVYAGSRSMAMEIGHMTIVADGGEECLCGKHGHLESYCSATALSKYTRRLLPDNPDSIIHRYMAENGGVYDNSMVTRGFRAGDRLCREIWDRYVHYLSVGVANVMTLFNPELVLIGGGVSNCGRDILSDPIFEITKELVIDPRQHCRVEIAHLGNKAGMFGACACAARKVGFDLDKCIKRT